MTLSEAIKSGFPFRRKGEHTWKVVTKSGYIGLQKDSTAPVYTSIPEICSTDWEIDEPKNHFKMQAQCWICPYCFDDHRFVAECKELDLKDVITRLRAENAKQSEIIENQTGDILDLQSALENIKVQGQFALNKHELRAFDVCAKLATEALK